MTYMQQLRIELQSWEFKTPKGILWNATSR